MPTRSRDLQGQKGGSTKTPHRRVNVKVFPGTYEDEGGGTKGGVCNMVTTVFQIPSVRGFGDQVHICRATLDGGESHGCAHKAASLSGLIENQSSRVKVRAFKNDSSACMVHVPRVLGGIILKRTLPVRRQVGEDRG